MIEPHRPLSVHGQAFWNSCINDKLGPQGVERLLVLCEQIDERVMLRGRVFQYHDQADRRALRQLDGQISAALFALYDNEPAADPAADAMTVMRKIKAALTKALAVATPSEVSTISKELSRVTAELGDLEQRGASKEMSKADELRARREARHRVINDDSAPTTRRSQPRRSAGNNRMG